MSMWDLEHSRSVEHFDCLSHAALCKSASAEDLDGFVRALVSTARREHLQQSNGTSKMDRLLLIRHKGHLIGDVFQPGLVGLAVRDHLGNSEGLEISIKVLLRGTCTYF
jgi:hypothetical protein